jgi:hypothetical protein
VPTEVIEHVAATDLQVGDTIKMFGPGRDLRWRKITEIRRSKPGATLYFSGMTETGRVTDRTCRATTLIERRIE